MMRLQIILGLLCMNMHAMDNVNMSNSGSDSEISPRSCYSYSSSPSSSTDVEPPLSARNQEWPVEDEDVPLEKEWYKKSGALQPWYNPFHVSSGDELGKDEFTLPIKEAHENGTPFENMSHYEVNNSRGPSPARRLTPRSQAIELVRDIASGGRRVRSRKGSSSESRNTSSEGTPRSNDATPRSSYDESLDAIKCAVNLKEFKAAIIVRDNITQQLINQLDADLHEKKEAERKYTNTLVRMKKALKKNAELMLTMRQEIAELKASIKKN